MGRGGEDGEPADQPPSASVEAVEAVTQTASSRVSSRFRTEDVQANKRFQDLALPDRMVTALNRCGFFQPSPVQESAIPLGLLGSDLIVQAKSGTGKTLVFSIICLSRVKQGSSATQALILAPTREVAIQSEQVITRLAAQLPVTVACFVGGLPVAGDEKKLRRSCQVVVGTPGRLVQLVGSGVLACESVSMLVLDEADALLGDSFYCDVTWLFDNLPRKKQVVACSATFTPDLLADLEPLMKRPQRVMMCEEEEKVSLKGVRQFYHLLTPEHSTATAASTATTTSPAASTRKVAVLMQLLTSCSFHQAAVFCNNKPQGEWLARLLTSRGLPAAFLAAGVAQEERGAIMAAMRAFKLRLVVSTDVLARGVDLERVNLVVNLDLPVRPAFHCGILTRTRHTHPGWLLGSGLKLPGLLAGGRRHQVAAPPVPSAPYPIPACQ
ncbi:P-loop containing nucleoside triphosphate hydrolase protein [Haematococcus lacustris]